MTVLLYAVRWQIAHLSLLTAVTPLDSGESKHDLIDLVHQAKPSIYTSKGGKKQQLFDSTTKNAIRANMFFNLIIYFYFKRKLNLVV